MIYGKHLPLFKEVFGKIAKWKHKGMKWAKHRFLTSQNGAVEVR
jgi:hypothetical protein